MLLRMATPWRSRYWDERRPVSVVHISIRLDLEVTMEPQPAHHNMQCLCDLMTYNVECHPIVISQTSEWALI